MYYYIANIFTSIQPLKVVTQIMCFTVTWLFKSSAIVHYENAQLLFFIWNYWPKVKHLNEPHPEFFPSPL